MKVDDEKMKKLDKFERLDRFFEKSGSGRYSSGSFHYLMFAEIIPMIKELFQEVELLKKELNYLQKPNACWRKNR